MIYLPGEDSKLLADVIKHYAYKKQVLDLGAGSGILSETAHNAGAESVFAVDNNPQVIVALKKKGIKAVRSNLFDKVKGKFDLIVCNPPYLPYDSREDAESSRITTGGKKGDEFILRMLSRVSSYLAPQGIILLVLSSLTPRRRIYTELKRYNLSHKIIATKNIFMEQLEVWKIERCEPFK